VTPDGVPPSAEPPGTADWDAEAYQRRFDELAAAGATVHGEADCVSRLGPSSVLDVGCGTGRVAAELARRGLVVVGIDHHEGMVATARRLAPGVEFHVMDGVGADLGRTFDLVVMAGNVPLFTATGTQGALVAGCARHLGPGGLLVAGFQLGRGYTVEEYDDHCRAAGLESVDRWSTWDGDPFGSDDVYAVSVHRRPT
jgi:SAM-dependent methyltransferase